MSEIEDLERELFEKRQRFRRGADGHLERVATAPFGPGDSFCPTWHVLDLLADGAAGWEPKYKYGS